jgi:hypothetical protein
MAAKSHERRAIIVGGSIAGPLSFRLKELAAADGRFREKLT